MLETIQTFHNLAAKARAEAAEVAAKLENAERHISVLAAALTEEEKAKLEVWLKAKEIK